MSNPSKLNLYRFISRSFNSSLKSALAAMVLIDRCRWVCAGVIPPTWRFAAERTMMGLQPAPAQLFRSPAASDGPVARSGERVLGRGQIRERPRELGIAAMLVVITSPLAHCQT